MRRLIFVLALLIATPAFAQDIPRPDRSDVVAKAKADLQTANVSLEGPCGAFKIVRLATWRMRVEGAGLLSKPSGNNCEGYATDIIVYPDGHHFDVLIGGGETNGPSWQDAGFIDKERWRTPIDTGFDPGVDGPPPTPTTPDDSIGLEELWLRFDALNAKLDALKAQSDANTEKIQQQLNQIVKDFEATAKSLSPFLGLLKK